MPDAIMPFINDYLIPWAVQIVTAILIFVIGRMIVKMVIKVLGSLLSRSGMDAMLQDFVLGIAHSLFLVFVIIAALDQLGVDTTSLVAVIGAAGLAIGLALQGSLENLAAGIMLIIFRPFKAGDFVEAGGVGGTVEKITLFNTVMRTPDNREIIVPNSSIQNNAITNYSARDTRRIDLVIGIGYDDDIKKAKELLTELVNADERIFKDPEATIAVSELADSSVNFVVRPWVNTSDYWAVRFDLTERIKLALDEAGISIPYPQMDVHVDK